MQIHAGGAAGPLHAVQQKWAPVLQQQQHPHGACPAFDWMDVKLFR